MQILTYVFSVKEIYTYRFYLSKSPPRSINIISQITNIFKFIIKTFGETSTTVTALNDTVIRFTFPGPPLASMHLHPLQLPGGGHQGVRNPGASLNSSYISIF